MNIERVPRAASGARATRLRVSFLARQRKLLRRSPIFAAAGFIGFLFLATVWNWAVQSYFPKLRIRSAEPLIGVTEPAPTPLSFAALLSGEMQKSVSSNFGRTLPVFNISVRAKNQFLYSLFRASGAPGTVIGVQDQLYQQPSIDAYCNAGAPPSAEVLGEWGQKIRSIQDILDAKGKHFVYLITPTKSATYPQYLPREIPCPGASINRLAPVRATLDARSVRYVDGPALMTNSKPNYPVELFARGGTHWNLLAGALAARKITDALPGSPLGRYDFDWVEIERARETDRDLLDLLNLIWPDDHYPTALVKGRDNQTPCERAPPMLAIGASFLFEVDFAFAQAVCAPDIDDYWYYYSPEGHGLLRRRFHIQKGSVNTGPPSPGGGDRELLESLNRAQIVVLEENESVIAQRSEVDDLLRAARSLQ
jgi:alginate O-acetyltransferase complex protein AlgJ